MTNHSLRVAIVGGGIGGLTLGLALREHGVNAEIYEAAPELAEIGAAVAQSANATKILRRLGLLDQLTAVATSPTELIYRDGRTGGRIAGHPVRNDGWYEAKFGAPYYGVHRADLQRVLGNAFGGQHLHLGCKLANLTEDADEVHLEFADGRTASADIVVGADGIRSTVRNWISGGDDLTYTGTSGFRGIVPMDCLPSLPDREAIQFWMGPDAHLLHFPIGGNAQDVNFLAVVEGPKLWPTGTRWQADATADERLEAFRGWHPAVTEMIDAAPHGIRWGLFVLQSLATWHQGRKVLIGDAAHAMLPHHGQGANTTIEDAYVLAALLATADRRNLDPALQHYQGLRRTRTRQIARSSLVTNDLLHIHDGPDIAARDQRMREFPEHFSWIHDFDAADTVARATAIHEPVGTR
jgi:salicylate hydroxylase